MKNQEPAIVFDREMAAAYDKRNAVFTPIRDALNFLMLALLAELPTDARILCIGVGTGLEVIDLAQAFPQWVFTLVEPAAPMLDICRQRVEEGGIAERCTLHQGYLYTLPASDSFNVATCLFVSHFFMESAERRNFFNQIALRLRPQGYLINADIAYDLSASAYPDILDIWLRVMKSGEISDEHIEKVRAAYGRDMAVLSPSAVASIMASGGFDPPVLFFQSLLLHAWYTKRTP